MRKEDRLHPVITLTVYYGEKQWDGPYSLKDMIVEMSEEEIQALYLEQFELTKGLNEANKCHKILDIGKRIIEHQQNSICATETYVNMALAKRVLYLLTINEQI